jgi:anti-sigma regulatory factor (Ser/Thr protein kinase)
MLIYSDGLNENETSESCAYERFLGDDFSSCRFLKPFLKKVNEKVENFDDDMTIIHLEKLETLCKVQSHLLPSTIGGIHDGINLCRDYMLQHGIEERVASTVALAVSELLMNAYEHGNLGIDSEFKQILIETDQYDSYLKKLESSDGYAYKKIALEFYIDEGAKGKWIRVHILDEGDGFDFSTTLKSLMFDVNVSLRGRGILMAQDMCDGVYFNEKGNAVTLVKML